VIRFLTLFTLAWPTRRRGTALVPANDPSARPPAGMLPCDVDDHGRVVPAVPVAQLSVWRSNRTGAPMRPGA